MYILMILVFKVITITDALEIINGPSGITVHSGEIANISCGFVGAPANTTIPDWAVAKKNALGIFSTKIISSSEIVNNHIKGFKWEAGGVNNSANSKLLVGPVDRTYNGSIYQCMFSFHGGSINSSFGVLVVIGKNTNSTPNFQRLQLPCVIHHFDRLFNKKLDDYPKILDVESILECNDGENGCQVTMIPWPTTRINLSHYGNYTCQCACAPCICPSYDNSWMRAVIITTILYQCIQIPAAIVETVHYIAKWLNRKSKKKRRPTSGANTTEHEALSSNSMESSHDSHPVQHDESGDEEDQSSFRENDTTTSGVLTDRDTASTTV